MIGLIIILILKKNVILQNFKTEILRFPQDCQIIISSKINQFIHKLVL